MLYPVRWLKVVLEVLFAPLCSVSSFRKASGSPYEGFRMPQLGNRELKLNFFLLRILSRVIPEYERFK